MKNNPLDLVLLGAALLFSMATSAHGLDFQLTVEISATQSWVRNNEEFQVSTTIRNVGSETATLRIWSCSYSEQWVTNNRAVRVTSVPCKKNDTIDVALMPGQTYERALALYMNVALGTGQRWPITFRLAFVPATFENNQAIAPVWSDAITIVAVE